MQALFMDMQKDISSEMLAVFAGISSGKKVFPFFKELTEGVIAHRRQIDQLIEQFSSNWKISRMSCVDRNIMRMAVYELLFAPKFRRKYRSARPLTSENVSARKNPGPLSMAFSIRFE